MIWIEAGTPAMGNVFLNAYHLTGESYFYLKAAQAAAKMLFLSGDSIQVGGWPYSWTFSGEICLSNGIIPKYRKHAFSLCLYAHYYGNCAMMMRPDHDSGMLCVCIYDSPDPKA